MSCPKTFYVRNCSGQPHVRSEARCSIVVGIVGFVREDPSEIFQTRLAQSSLVVKFDDISASNSDDDHSRASSWLEHPVPERRKYVTWLSAVPVR
jgi:hypothetical protein